MSQTIVFANLGNRNLKIRKDDGTIKEIEKGKFYEETQRIWENYEKEKYRLVPAILPAIIEKFPKGILVLFSTKQQDPHKDDTYYEGLILEKLLQEKYSGLKIVLEDLNSIDPTKEDLLISAYIEKLRKIAEDYPDAAYVLYDSGGTSQQKGALKAVIEFMYEKAKNEDSHSEGTYLIYQGYDDHKQGTILRKLERSAVELLNLKTDIRVLVEHFDYAGALRLSEGLTDDDDKLIRLLLKFGYSLWHNRWGDIKKLIPQVQSSAKSEMGVQDNLKKLVDYVENGVTIYDFSVENIRNCRMLIFKAYNQYVTKDYTGATLTLNQFVEMFLGSFIECHTGCKLINNRNNRREEEKRFIRELDPEVREELNKQVKGEFETVSIPIQVGFVKLFVVKDPERFRQEGIILKEIEEMNVNYKGKPGLSTRRNIIAHEGEGVEESGFARFTNSLETLYQSFITTVDSDPFQTLNKLIIKTMTR